MSFFPLAFTSLHVIAFDLSRLILANHTPAAWLSTEEQG